MPRCVRVTDNSRVAFQCIEFQYALSQHLFPMKHGMKKKPRKKMMGGGTAKKPAVPTMTYGGAQKFIMKEMGGSNGKKPTALLKALKAKYPEEFTYGGGTMGQRKMAKPTTMKRGGKTARKRKK